MRVVRIILGGALLAAALPVLPAQAAGPDGLKLAGVDQVIVVTAASWSSTTATLRAYERTGDGWRTVVAGTPALLGYGGLVPAKERRQGTGKTPAGKFAITWAFGSKPDPGTALRYRQFDRQDAWTYNPADPSTYNIFQTADRNWDSYGRYVEKLHTYGKQYRYVAVLDFNLPAGPIVRGPDGVRRAKAPADTKLGGGIFLHVSNGERTAGCIAISEPVMRQLLQWLDPGAKPTIVIGTKDSLS